MASSIKGIVKAVPSGDTVHVMGLAQNGPPPEKQITLSNISTPRLGRRDGQQKDEPFAWDAREFLRQKCIGQNVTFKIESSHPASGRDFGSVALSDNTDLASLMVGAGWARVKTVAAADMTPEIEALSALERTAQEKGLGLWTKNAHAISAAVREIPATDKLDAAEFVQSLGKEPQNAIVDSFLDGGKCRIILVPSHHSLLMLLSGIQAPGIKREADGQEVAQPFAREARFFSESRLLNRDVRVILEGVDKYNNYFGTILHPAGRLSEELAKAGLAKVAEWSIGFATYADEIREAERTAKKQQLRMWKGYQAPANASVAVSGKDFQGKVLEIVTGDTLVVLDVASSEPRKVSLSSVRTPRLGNPRRDEKPEPCAYECKELLRSKVIGKRVRVLVEYARPIGQEQRQFCSIFDGKTNLAELIVEQGFATVVKHRHDDERSANYDALLAAEQKAMAAGVGLHSKEPPSIRHINDFSIPHTAAKAKSLLPFFQRSGRVKGVCEYVSNGARLKVLIPKESCVVTIALASLRVDNASRPGGPPGSVHGDGALAYTRERVFQHDIEVQVEDCDKNGTFLGDVFFAKGKSLSEALLEEGFAYLSGYCENQVLKACERDARNAKRRVWENYDEAAANAAAEEAVATESDERVEVIVTEITDAVSFFVHRTSDNVSELEQRMAELNAKLGDSQAPDYSPKVGEIVLGKFTGDDAWYRARVEKKSGQGATVNFIDYGNSEDLPPSRLQPQTADCPSLSTIPALAQECRLSYIKPPPADEDTSIEASLFFKQLVWDKTLSARLDYKEQKVLNLTLFEQGSSTSVNAAMLRAGMASLNKRLAKRFASKVGDLQAEEQTARLKHVGIWEHGDIPDSDEDELKPGERRRPGGGR